MDVPGLEIDLLGGLALRRDGVAVALPASRKARALLAFLILSAKPQHRERLCDLFWDGPDDPRGALRSALWKLRPLVDTADAKRLVADRERVHFEPEGACIDYRHLADRVASGAVMSDAELADARAALDQPLLAGLDLPNHRVYQAWLTAHRAEAETLRARLFPGLAVAPLASSDTGACILPGSVSGSARRPTERASPGHASGQGHR